MKQIINKLNGDKGIWVFVALLALYSFLLVFSASTNLAYMAKGSGDAITYLLKHFVHIALGFIIIFKVHQIPYHYFRGISKIALPIVWIILLYTGLKGTVIDGANASRWIVIPFLGTFQPSTAAAIVLYVYVARYLSKTRDVVINFKSSLLELWLPVFITIGLIFPSNFSTAALIFSMVIMLVYVGMYPLKHIGIILVTGLLFVVFFVLTVKAFPNAFPNRVDTWISRVENFTSNKVNEDDEYQIEKAKIAIATGGLTGKGPGKSVQKNFLPQSSSDFIFAIIVEEYGLLGGLAAMGLYLLLFFRFIVAAHKANSLFGKLVVVGLGFPLIFQALINMMVAVQLVPVTGQTLPFLSSGGSSIWMTCVSIGIILSVTKKEEEIKAELDEKLKRDEALKKLIDKQLLDDEEEESSQNTDKEEFSIEEKNPLEPILKK